MEDHKPPEPDEVGEDIVLALFARFDAKAYAAAMIRHGSTWTDEEDENAGRRALVLTTLDPPGGSPEADEMAAIFRRQDEYATVKYGEDGWK